MDGSGSCADKYESGPVQLDSDSEASDGGEATVSQETSESVPGHVSVYQWYIIPIHRLIATPD